MMFDLQRFADEAVAESENAPAESENKTENSPDVQTLINEAFKKFKAELETERKDRESAKKEAERLSKLSDDERAKAELETARHEIELEKSNLERERNKYETTQVLAKRGLPIEFTEYLIAENNEKTLERITTFEKAYKKAIEAAVNEKLKGKIPASSGNNVENSGKSFAEAIRSAQIRR